MAAYTQRYDKDTEVLTEERVNDSIDVLLELLRLNKENPDVNRTYSEDSLKELGFDLLWIKSNLGKFRANRMLDRAGK